MINNFGRYHEKNTLDKLLQINDFQVIAECISTI